MDEGIATVVVALTANFGIILALWHDTRKRTNGSGPLAEKLDRIDDRVRHVEQGVARLEGRRYRG